MYREDALSVFMEKELDGWKTEERFNHGVRSPCLWLRRVLDTKGKVAVFEGVFEFFLLDTAIVGAVLRDTVYDESVLGASV